MDRRSSRNRGADFPRGHGQQRTDARGPDRRGALVADGTTLEELPAFPVVPVDTTAAGDAFAGALAASLADGKALATAVRRGLAAGALATTVRGASPSLPTAAQVDGLLAAHG